MFHGKRLLYALILCLPAQGLVTRGAAAAADAPVAAQIPDSASILKWIAELESERYEQREQATKYLEKGGPDAARAIGEAAAGDRLETTIRGVRILERMFLTGDDDASEAAETALDQLTNSPNRSAARRASVSLNTQGLRQQRALVKISELGGSSEVLASMHNQNGNPLVAKVSLLRNWKGGDAGLKHIRKIPELPRLQVVAGSNVSLDALEKLQREMPNLEILHRGPAMLGVGGIPVENGLRVSQLAPDSAALKAGIQEGDIITKFNGHLINDFDSLVELTSKTHPGEEVLVEVLRGEDRASKPDSTLTMKVKMGEWK